MSTEKQNFQNWIDQKDIKQILFDLDDTICDTSKIFAKALFQSAEFLTKNHPFLTREQWHEEVKILNNNTFEKYGVNPNKWDYGVDDMSRKYEITPENQASVKKILQEIYKTPVEMLYGSETGLDFLTQLNISIGIVTHANAEWTWEKYDWLNLKRFVKPENVVIIDENGHKTAESWQQAAMG